MHTLFDHSEVNLLTKQTCKGILAEILYSLRLPHQEMKPAIDSRIWLSMDDRAARLHYCLDQVNVVGHPPMYQNMYNRLHLQQSSLYLIQEGKQNHTISFREPTCIQNQKVTKLVLLSVVGRPRSLNSGAEVWDGKVGVFGYAVRTINSHERLTGKKGKRHKAGKHSKPKITEGQKFRRIMLDRIIPAIKQRCPASMQQDVIEIEESGSAKRLVQEYAEFDAKARKIGVDMVMYRQPENSPELNVVNLGLIDAIRSGCCKEGSQVSDIMDLISLVSKSFWGYPLKELNSRFLLQQKVMNEIFRMDGNNRFSLEELSRDLSCRDGTLPDVLQVMPCAQTWWWRKVRGYAFSTFLFGYYFSDDSEESDAEVNIL